jgi:hypothetical protein
MVAHAPVTSGHPGRIPVGWPGDGLKLVVGTSHGHRQLAPVRAAVIQLGRPCPVLRLASCVQRARLTRMARVSGCCWPKSRSRTASSAANWSRAHAGSPASPVQPARPARVAAPGRPRVRLHHRAIHLRVLRLPDPDPAAGPRRHHDRGHAASRGRDALMAGRQASYQWRLREVIGPNEVWSWDITKLAGPQPGLYYHLYVMLDIFSRCAARAYTRDAVHFHPGRNGPLRRSPPLPPGQSVCGRRVARLRGCWRG